MAGCCCYHVASLPPFLSPSLSPSFLSSLSCGSHGCQISSIGPLVSRPSEIYCSSSWQGGFGQSEFSGRNLPSRESRHFEISFLSTEKSQIFASSQRSSARDAALLEEEIMTGLKGGKVSRRKSKVSRGDWRTIEVVRDDSFQEELEALFWDRSSSDRSTGSSSSRNSNGSSSSRNSNGSRKKASDSQSRGLLEELLREEGMHFISSRKSNEVLEIEKPDRIGEAGESEERGENADRQDSEGGRESEEGRASEDQAEKGSGHVLVKYESNIPSIANSKNSLHKGSELEGKMSNGSSSFETPKGNVPRNVDKPSRRLANNGAATEKTNLVVEESQISDARLWKDREALSSDWKQIELESDETKTSKSGNGRPVESPILERDMQKDMEREIQRDLQQVLEKDLAKEFQNNVQRGSVFGMGKLSLQRSPNLAQIEKSTLVQELEILREAQSIPPTDFRRRTERERGEREMVVEEELKQTRRLISRKGESLAEARATLQQLVRGHPLNPNVWVHYAQLERQTGNLKEARSRYEQSIKVFEYWKDFGSQYVRALQAWGTLENLDGRSDVARKLFQKAVKIAKKRDMETSEEGMAEAGVVCLHSWAMLEQRNGNWAKARQLLQKAEALQPNNQIILQSRAVLEKKAHNWGLARKYFRLSTESAPSDAICWQAWGVMEGELGNISRMRELFKQSLSISPMNMHTLQAWAHNEAKLESEESREKARDLYKKCVDVSPHAVFAWQSWAVMEQKAGNLERARQLFQSGLKASPADVACLQAYAVLERECGNFQAAREILGLALATDPHNSAVFQQVAEVEEKLGHVDAAKELYIRAGLLDRKNNKKKKEMFEKRKFVSQTTSRSLSIDTNNANNNNKNNKDNKDTSDNKINDSKLRSNDMLGKDKKTSPFKRTSSNLKPNRVDQNNINGNWRRFREENNSPSSP